MSLLWYFFFPLLSSLFHVVGWLDWWVVQFNGWLHHTSFYSFLFHSPVWCCLISLIILFLSVVWLYWIHKIPHKNPCHHHRHQLTQRDKLNKTKNLSVGQIINGKKPVNKKKLHFICKHWKVEWKWLPFTWFTWYINK